jgi:hypothetical protein
MKSWQYFKYEPLVTVRAIYRRPFSEKRITTDDALEMDLLRPDGSWIFNSNDKRLFDLMCHGDLDFQDEISEELVNELFAIWKATEWPDAKR